MSSEYDQGSGRAADGKHEGLAAPPPISKGRVGLVLFAVMCVAILLAVTGILPRIHAEKKLASETNMAAVPQVFALTPKAGSPAQEIVLPGNIQAYQDAPIYARTSGYLKQWYVDIGTRVKKGQLLALIDSPEVDQQLQQGRADLATAQSNLDLSQTTAARFANLLKTNSVSQQDADNAAADARGKLTIVQGAQANLKRLEDLQSFERITAPFPGVITARNTDNGQLINAGGAGAGSSNAAGPSSGVSSGNSRELFHIASTDRLRVFVNVPQIYSREAKPSTTAELTLEQFPGRRFPGKLVRNADAIDLATRTLLVEIDMDNAHGELLPGSYAQVHLKLANGVPAIILPVSALIFRAEGLQVAALEGDRARLVNVAMGRDFGTQVEIVSGLAPGQRVIDSPPDSLTDNQQVRVVERQANASPATK